MDKNKFIIEYIKQAEQNHRNTVLRCPKCGYSWSVKENKSFNCPNCATEVWPHL